MIDKKRQMQASGWGEVQLRTTEDDNREGPKSEKKGK